MTNRIDRVARENRLALAVLCSTLILSGLDVTIMNLAVPDVVARFGAGPTARIWTVNGYELTVASLLLTAGVAAVRLGYRRAFLAGLAVFGAGSLLGASAWGIATVITARILLGIGYALVMSSTLGLLRVVFAPARERSRALGYWTASSSLGMALGPVLGGALVQVGGWRAAFLVNIPVVLGAFVFARRALPAVPPRAVRLDGPSVGLSVAALGLGSYAIQSVADHAEVSRTAVVLAVVAAVLAGAFWVRQRRAATPLVPPPLVAERSTRLAMGVIVMSFGSYAGLIYLLTGQLQDVHRVSSMTAGALVIPLALANVLGASRAPLWSVRWGPRGVLTAGSASVALGFGALAAFGLPYGYPGVLLVGAGIGTLFTQATELMLGSAPPERAARVGAVQEMCFSAGGGLGVGIFGTLAAALTAALERGSGVTLWCQGSPGEIAFGLTALGAAAGFTALAVGSAIRAGVVGADSR